MKLLTINCCKGRRAVLGAPPPRHPSQIDAIIYLRKSREYCPRYKLTAHTIQLHFSKAALDLLFGLETLRPTFPEVEHFSLVLRELHDSGALALALHARTLVSRLGGLRLVDVKHRQDTLYI